SIPNQSIGELLPIKEGAGGLHFISTGSMVKTATILGLDYPTSSVWSAPTIKPINDNQVRDIALKANTIVVLEEHSTAGGLGSTIAEIVSEVGGCKVLRLGISDR